MHCTTKQFYVQFSAVFWRIRDGTVLIVTERNFVSLSFWETGRMNSVVHRRSFPFHSATATLQSPSIRLFKLRSRYNASREQIFLPERSHPFCNFWSLWTDARDSAALATRFWSSCYGAVSVSASVRPIFPCFKIDPFFHSIWGRDGMQNAECRGKVSSDHKIHTISMVEIKEGRRTKRKREKQMRSLLRQN